MVEQLIRNQQVGGSTPLAGSIFFNTFLMLLSIMYTWCQLLVPSFGRVPLQQADEGLALARNPMSVVSQGRLVVPELLAYVEKGSPG